MNNVLIMEYAMDITSCWLLFQNIEHSNIPRVKFFFLFFFPSVDFFRYFKTRKHSQTNKRTNKHSFE